MLLAYKYDGDLQKCLFIKLAEQSITLKQSRVHIRTSSRWAMIVQKKEIVSGGAANKQSVIVQSVCSHQSFIFITSIIEKDSNVTGNQFLKRTVNAKKSQSNENLLTSTGYRAGRHPYHIDGG